MSKGLMQWSRAEAGARGRGAQTWGARVVGGCGLWGGRGRCSHSALPPAGPHQGCGNSLSCPPSPAHPLLPAWLSGLKVA